MRTLVTGATGFVGERLLGRLTDPVILTRSATKARESLGMPKLSAFDWSPEKQPPPTAAFENVSTVIHLAGESVSAGRWTAAKRKRIRDSRILGTRLLVDGIEKAKSKPSVLVSASAIGYYGSRGDDILDESSPPGNDFLAGVCIGWEEEARRAEELGVRVVNLRIGLVLGQGGGAMSAMQPLFRWFIGGRMGLSGRQWWSWIHVEDLVSMFLFAATNNALKGPANGTAPNPVTNREFTRALGKAMHRPAIFHGPGPALSLALGGFAGVLLASQRVLPKAAQSAGFKFQYPELPAALADILRAK